MRGFSYIMLDKFGNFIPTKTNSYVAKDKLFHRSAHVVKSEFLPPQVNWNSIILSPMHRFQEQVASQGRMLSAIEDGIYNCSPFTLQQKKVYMIFFE
jgi:hypothetical protein